VPGQRPTLVVIAGPNGSGKTSLTAQLFSHEWLCNCVIINPDDIARDRFGDWNSPKAVAQAVQVAQTMREQCLAEKRSFVFETVLSSPEKLEFLRRASREGYFIRIFFIATTSPEINAARVARRFMEGGHDVPIPKIISRFAKSLANCMACATFVDRAYLYDNSKDGQTPRLLFRTHTGNIVKTYGEMPDWAQKIKEGIQTHSDQ